MYICIGWIVVKHESFKAISRQKCRNDYSLSSVFTYIVCNTYVYTFTTCDMWMILNKNILDFLLTIECFSIKY